MCVRERKRERGRKEKGREDRERGRKEKGREERVCVCVSEKERERERELGKSQSITSQYES